MRGERAGRRGAQGGCWVDTIGNQEDRAPAAGALPGRASPHSRPPCPQAPHCSLDSSSPAHSRPREPTVAPASAVPQASTWPRPGPPSPPPPLPCRASAQALPPPPAGAPRQVRVRGRPRLSLRHCVRARRGRAPGRWRVTPASHLLPAPGPGPRGCVPSLPAGGVAAGAALGKEAVERPAAARGGTINLEQMWPDSRSAWGLGGGLSQSVAELGGRQVEVTWDFGHTDPVSYATPPRLSAPCEAMPEYACYFPPRNSDFFRGN